MPVKMSQYHKQQLQNRKRAQKMLQMSKTVTLQEIADKYHITRQRVGQIVKREAEREAKDGAA